MIIITKPGERILAKWQRRTWVWRCVAAAVLHTQHDRAVRCGAAQGSDSRILTVIWHLLSTAPGYTPSYLNELPCGWEPHLENPEDTIQVIIYICNVINVLFHVYREQRQNIFSMISSGIHFKLIHCMLLHQTCHWWKVTQYICSRTVLKSNFM